MFPEKLKKLRISKKYTQNYLGNLLHVSYKTIGVWERGTRQPPIDAIQKLSDIFGVSTDFLLKNEKTDSNSKTENDLKEFLDRNLEQGMTYDHKKLTDEDKERLKIALIQTF